MTLKAPWDPADGIPMIRSMAHRSLVPSAGALLLCAGLLSGCIQTQRAGTSGSVSAGGSDLRAWTYVPDLPISEPPYKQVHASWKQRLDVPYVYLDQIGSYARTGALIPVLHREMLAQGLEADGPPFALFFDDPARVPITELRSRACIPLRGARAVKSPLGYQVMRSTTVGYAFASGPYPQVPRAYPGIFAYLRKMNWEQNGPIREVYLVPPGANPDPSQLVCEIQIPAAPPE
jgi:effector-binding domain-containing protein